MLSATTTMLLTPVAVILNLHLRCVSSLAGVHDQQFRTRVQRSSLEGRLDFQKGTDARSTRLSSSLDAVHFGDESEWYVEPSPTPKVQPPPPVKLPKGAVPSVREIESKAELLEFLFQDDRLCVVRFHATWCKSCQKFGLHFDKLAARKADWVDPRTGSVLKKNEVRIASIEWSKSESLCNSLGITKLPTVQIYSMGLKVAQIAVPASKFGKVQETVDQFLSLSTDDLYFAAKMEQGASLVESKILKPSAETAGNPVAAADRVLKMQEKLLEAESRHAGVEQSARVSNPHALSARVKTSAASPDRTSTASLRKRWWVSDA
ncbi:hypothetical protein ACA910_005088 [Epithemia clementina (nom. ined.)]